MVFDLATVVGVALAIGLIGGAVSFGGGALGAFVNGPAIAVVIGGSLAAALVCFPLRTFLSLGKVIRKSLARREDSSPKIVEQLVAIAEISRRTGLLSLEQHLAKIENRFVVSGLEMAIDGVRAAALEETMRNEMKAMNARHRDGKSIVEQLGRFSPAFGMIGTLIGLIIMLGSIREPSQIGIGMAVALVTTLYGAIAANAIFLPCAEKLSHLNKQELLQMEIIVRGVLAIQAGDHPRIVHRKLNAFLSPAERSRPSATIAAAVPQIAEIATPSTREAA